MATRISETKKEGPGGSSTTVKTTTYESSRSYENEGPSYRPGIQGRNLIIQRSSYGGPSQTKTVMDRSMTYSMGAPSGAYSNMTTVGAQNIKTGREREKKDMQDLNERFANYIERVRFLEAQNRKLADELDRLKSKWGKETTAIKAMYQAELDEARKLLDDAEKEKARLQIRSSTLENEIEELRTRLDDSRNQLSDANEKITKQNETLSQYESEINLLQRRVECLENDREKDKKEIARLQDGLNRARVDLDNETLAHIDAENRRQTLEEELEFLKQVHEQEMKELAALAYRDTTNENREFWKSELASAIREIQVTYDEKLDGMRGELETYYNMKVQEFRTGAAKNNMESVHAKEETKRLRGQVTDLRSKLGELEGRNHQLERELADLKRDFEERTRELELERNEFQDQAAKRTAELEAVLKEMQDLMDCKLGLELEIAAYRKLLEGEENNRGSSSFSYKVLSSLAEFGSDGGQGTKSSSSSSTTSVSKTEQKKGDKGGVVTTTTTTTSKADHKKPEPAKEAPTPPADKDSNLKVSQVVKGEMSAKTTYQRSAKGPVAINECAADGKYIVIENTGRRDEQLGSWQLKRVIDGVEKANHTFDARFVLRPGTKVKVFAGAKPASAAAHDIEANVASFGVGANIITKLVNPANEDRATHVTRTTYTS